jgi:NAD(P)-dependent dehydrogenase (short-subunit alcohol dehydrogenase family)
MSVTYNFSNKVVLITGGTGAFGRTLVKRFLESGARTIASYRNQTEADKLKSVNPQVEIIKLDISNEKEILKMVPKLISNFSRIDVLVNTVGGYLGGKNITELKEDDWESMMNLNLKSAYLISKHVIPIMKSAKGGKIIHVSSRTGLKSDGYDSAYAASKAALIRFVDSISQEFREDKININCILPTTIDTESNRRAMPNADFSKWLSPEDLANVVMFLCSSESKVINGAAIPTYGLS